MKLQVIYSCAIFAISILLVLSSPVVARPASPSTVTPLQERACSWLLRPYRRLYGKLVNLVLQSFSQANRLSSQESPILEHSFDGSLSNISYEEQLVLRFHLGDRQDAVHIAKASTDLLLDVWESNEKWVDVRVQAKAVQDLLSRLPASPYSSFEVLLDGSGLLEAINSTYPSGSTVGSSEELSGGKFPVHTSEAISTNDSVFFDDYRPLSVITSWMHFVCSMFPSHSQVIRIGQSYEGREIHALRVGASLNSSSGPRKPRKTIIVSGGMHAREWVGVSTVNYIADSLITGYGKYLDITSMVENFDWIFIPTLNPDGYAYTWQTDRLWRKTRQPTPLRFCRGIDLDRAFGFRWTGDSVNPCSENYAGEQSFESVEAQALASWTRNETEHNHVQFVGFLDMHSYSQQILYPYSYSCGDQPPTLEDLQELALGLAKAIRLGGAVYQITSACSGNVLSEEAGGIKPEEGTESGGSALDWFYQELGIRHAFQFKLRDNGAYGFLLPKEFIIPTGQEILNAVKHFAYSLEPHDDKVAEGDMTQSPRPLEPPSLWSHLASPSRAQKPIH